MASGLHADITAEADAVGTIRRALTILDGIQARPAAVNEAAGHLTAALEALDDEAPDQGAAIYCPFHRRGHLFDGVSDGAACRNSVREAIAIAQRASR